MSSYSQLQKKKGSRSLSINSIKENDYRTFLLTEFEITREEILKRVELQHQLLIQAITIFGVILGVVTFTKASSNIIFLYPLLAVFISFAWSANNRRVKEMQLYIAWFIEGPILQELSWEWFRAAIPRPFNLHFSSWTNLSAAAIFVGSEMLSGIIGIIFSKADYPLLFFDIICIIITFIIVMPPDISIGDKKYNPNLLKDIMQGPTDIFRQKLSKR